MLEHSDAPVAVLAKYTPDFSGVVVMVYGEMFLGSLLSANQALAVLRSELLIVLVCGYAILPQEVAIPPHPEILWSIFALQFRRRNDVPARFAP